MAQKKQRFTFDDEDSIEISKEELDSTVKNNATNEDVNDGVNEKSFFKKKNASTSATTDSNGVDDGDISMKKNGKKRFKLRWWQIALLVFLTLSIIFMIYVFSQTNEDGPVYGDRCASLLAIDDSKFSSVEAQITEDQIVNSVKIEVDCRIIKITINYIDNANAEDAKNVAINALHLLDDTMAAQKEEGASYSQLFGQANGRGQYNVEFNLTSNGDPTFPIFGTKHPSNDEISFTGATPKNQETTDRVNAKAAEGAQEE